MSGDGRRPPRRKEPATVANGGGTSRHPPQEAPRTHQAPLQARSAWQPGQGQGNFLQELGRALALAMPHALGCLLAAPSSCFSPPDSQAGFQRGKRWVAGCSRCSSFCSKAAAPLRPAQSCAAFLPQPCYWVSSRRPWEPCPESCHLLCERPQTLHWRPNAALRKIRELKSAMAPPARPSPHVLQVPPPPSLRQLPPAASPPQECPTSSPEQPSSRDSRSGAAAPGRSLATGVSVWEGPAGPVCRFGRT